jgi:hypothetical protein
MKTKHNHRFVTGKSGKVAVCKCGAFKHVNLDPADVIVGLDRMIDFQFEKNQSDYLLDDAKVQWMGQQVRLYVPAGMTSPKQIDMAGTLATMTADKNAVRKIKVWCVKNHYRCSQIQNGKVIL